MIVEMGTQTKKISTVPELLVQDSIMVPSSVIGYVTVQDVRQDEGGGAVS